MKKIKGIAGMAASAMLVLSMSVSVFASGENANIENDKKLEAEKADVNEGVKESVTLFWNKKEGSDKNKGFSMESPVKSFSAVKDIIGKMNIDKKEKDIKKLLSAVVICGEEELTEEETAFMKDKEISVVTEEAYLDSLKKVEETGEGTKESPAETADGQQTMADDKQTEPVISETEETVTPDTEKTEIDLNTPGETVFEEKEDVSPIPPIIEEEGIETVQEPLLLAYAAEEPLLSTVPVLNEQITAGDLLEISDGLSTLQPAVQEPVVQQITTQEPSASEISDGQGLVSETMELMIPGRDIIGTGTTNTGGASAPVIPAPTSVPVKPSAQNEYKQYGPAAPVNTGDMDMFLPYIVCAAAGAGALIVFKKLSLEKKRSVKNLAYAKEMEDFRKACIPE